MRLIFLTLFALAVTTFSHAANADADEASKRSAELQVLDRFVGTWDIVVTTETPEGKVATGKTSETRTWSLGGKFVHFQTLRRECLTVCQTALLNLAGRRNTR